MIWLYRNLMVLADLFLPDLPLYFFQKKGFTLKEKLFGFVQMNQD